jgi:hypothetical protein
VCQKQLGATKPKNHSGVTFHTPKTMGSQWEQQQQLRWQTSTILVMLEENQEQQLQQHPDLATNADGHGHSAGERSHGRQPAVGQVGVDEQVHSRSTQGSRT